MLLFDSRLVYNGLVGELACEYQTVKARLINNGHVSVLATVVNRDGILCLGFRQRQSRMEMHPSEDDFLRSRFPT